MYTREEVKEIYEKAERKHKDTHQYATKRFLRIIKKLHESGHMQAARNAWYKPLIFFLQYDMKTTMDILISECNKT